MTYLPRSHMPFKYMGNFKAVAIDYEYYLTLSDKPQSVCLTERQMYVLSVQNTYTGWLTRWYNTEDITQKTVQFIAAEIEELLMCGCGIPEPTITDRVNAQTYITDTATSYEATYNTWNTAGQTVASIAPNLDYSSGSIANKDKLLCLALQMLVIDIVEAAKANKQGTSQQNKDMVKNLGNTFGAMATAGGAAIATGGAAAAFVGFLGGPYLVMGLALAAVGLAIANLVYTTDLSVFEDEDASTQIQCTLVENIVGSTPTRARFQAGLTPNSFVSGSNAEKLAAIVQPFLDDLDTYLNFLATANGLYDVSDFGILPDCPCGDYIYEWDLQGVTGGWVVNGAGQATFTINGAEFAAFNNGITYYIGAQIKKTVPSGANITRIELDVASVVLGVTGSGGRFTLANAATLSTPPTQPTLAGTNTYSFDVVQDDTEVLALSRASDQNGAYGGGSGVIKRVRVYGQATPHPAFTGGVFL